MSPIGSVGRSVRGRRLPDEAAIPDSVVSLYKYEDDNDTTTAIDSEADNDATISGASYTSTAKVGGLALSHDGTDDETVSNSAVDLSSLGTDDGFGIAAWINVQSTGDLANNFAISWTVDTNNHLSVTESGSGDIKLFAQESDSNFELDPTSINTGSWYHVAANHYSDNTYEFIVHDTNGDLVSSDSASSSNDPTQKGSGNHETGHHSGFDNHLEVIVDDFAAAQAPLTSSDIDNLVSRGT